VSLAFAVPVAIFDLAHVSGSLEVRHAEGDEQYESWSRASSRFGVDPVSWTPPCSGHGRSAHDAEDPTAVPLRHNPNKGLR
jgi:hypothetical protein